MVVESLDIGSLFGNLQALGFYDFLLPFLLVFTVIFAMLEKTKLMGTTEDRKPRTNINTLLALIVGLIVVVQTSIVEIINNYLSKMSLFIIIVLIFLLVVGIFGGNIENGFTGWPLGIAFIISVIAVLWALSPELGLGDFFNRYYIFTDADKGLLLFAAIFFLVVWMVTKKPRGDHPSWITNLGDALSGRVGRHP
ncbi:hypothetical protein HYX18_03280 [Candidatus Woesearchaeota archaeon]|nr:hypothetical protein [Candidatus Woesearchaeota archaeon]